MPKESPPSPKVTKAGHARRSEIPSTLQRSDTAAQDTFAEAHDAALESYDGDEQRAGRVAWAAVKHTHEKVGDHWAPKEGGRRGPSDPRSESGADTDRRSSGGVDEHATESHLLELAREAGVRGRSSMTKAELVEALRKANDRATARARS